MPSRKADQQYIEHTDIKRTAAYYTSRLPHSSILLGSPTSEDKAGLAVQVLSHADGTVGSLFTYPRYRRKGLGAALVKAHVASGRGTIKVPADAGRAVGIECTDGTDGYGQGEGSAWAWTHIYNGNTASEALFRRLGFASLWDAAWIYRPDGRAVPGGQAETEA